MRALATIARISELREHPNADLTKGELMDVIRTMKEKQ